MLNLIDKLVILESFIEEQETEDKETLLQYLKDLSEGIGTMNNKIHARNVQIADLKHKEKEANRTVGELVLFLHQKSLYDDFKAFQKELNK